MSISIKDVAARGGVSTPTVSHVINETCKISPATRKGVMAAVDRLGYSINRAPPGICRWAAVTACWAFRGRAWRS